MYHSYVMGIDESIYTLENQGISAHLELTLYGQLR